MANNPTIESLSEQVEALTTQNGTLAESLQDVTRSLAFEDRGWTLISELGGDEHEGLTLPELQEISKKIRPYMTGGSLIKRGSELHIGYVWGKGVSIEGTEAPTGRGRPSDLRKFYMNTVNQESIFSPSAHGEIQRARYSDGNVLAVCNKGSGTVRRIPVSEITDVRVNPDFPEEVWAYQRTWNPDPASTAPEPKIRWYYTNRFSGTRQQFITTNSVRVEVAPETIIDKRFNRQVGWPLGIPDATAAMPWFHAYSEIMRYGRVVNEALAKMLYKIVSKSPTGAAAAAVKVADMTGHGNSLSLVQGQDVNAINSAGKGYDFASSRPVAAMIAASLNVPNIELLADSSAAGSSYGAAQSLTPSTLNAMQVQQAEWIEFFHEIFEFFGFGTPHIWFDPITEPDFYRVMQGITLAATALSDEEYRGKVLDALNIRGNSKEIPPALKLRSQPKKQAASPDQGKNSPAGGTDNQNDTNRNDTIGETLEPVWLDDLRELVERLEVARA